ncbi:hypothetical protein BJY01DRAFT_254781 [Aspergillus pseudoustus]|uniref:Uncharacterized protein n=1 Tax=Aspergillus pseudoustus TaxID=1810923 RepID=A0ABR4IS65_9EURO
MAPASSKLALPRWLEEYNHRLLLFDDATSPYTNRIPQPKGIATTRLIVLTTRDGRLAHAVAGVKSEVPSTDRPNAIKLLLLDLAVSLAFTYLWEYPWVPVVEYIKQISPLSKRPRTFKYKQAFSNYDDSTTECEPTIQMPQTSSGFWDFPSTTSSVSVL